jgi:hypothetical protein
MTRPFTNAYNDEGGLVYREMNDAEYAQYLQDAQIPAPSQVSVQETIAAAAAAAVAAVLPVVAPTATPTERQDAADAAQQAALDVFTANGVDSQGG